MRFIGSLLALSLVACTGPVDPGVGEGQQKIVGGTETSGDPSVVMIFAYGPYGGGSCTGEVIAPRVVLTAAHCVHPDEIGAGASFVIYNGPDMSKARYSEYFRAREGIPNPDFDPSAVGSGNDVGVLMFDQDLPYEPLRWNRQPITDEMVGKTVRFVGYGIVSGEPQDQNTSGVKRETTTTLDGYDDNLLDFDSTEHNTCSGDSGGPAFMDFGDGKGEVIIGVTSFGITQLNQVDCMNGGYDSRVDRYADWIDAQVATTGWVPPEKRPVPTKQLGDACTAHSECVSAMCALNTKTSTSFCTATCDPKAKMQPAGYACEKVDTQYLLVKGSTKGCSVTGSPSETMLSLCFVLAALAIARRRPA